MNRTDPVVWKDIHAHLRQSEPQICRQWFDEIEDLGIRNGAIGLRAGSNVHRDYLRKQCVQKFNDAAQHVSGALIAVRFYGPEDDVPSADRVVETKPAPKSVTTPPTAPRASTNGHAGAPVEPAPEAPRRRAPVHVSSEAAYLNGSESLVINPDNDFDHFIIGPNNRLAHAASVAVSDQPGRAYNPLFIHGDVGLGKTHLLQAICLRIKQRNPDAVIHYVSCDGFMTAFMKAVQSGEMEGFRHRYRDVDMLVIDDIHFLTKRDRTQEEFFNTFNSLYQAEKQIVLSSDEAPEHIPDLEDRLVSRFNWGLVTKVDEPTYETRVEILKAKSRLRNLEMPDDAACFVAARMTGNIRELEGAIGKIQLHASVFGTGNGERPTVTLDLVKTALGEPNSKPLKGPSIDTIIEEVSDFYSVRRTDVLGKRRQQSISTPRQVCMFLAKQMTRNSLQEIGGYFGGRDHTTVIHALRVVEKRMVDDPEFQAIVEMLKKNLQSGN